MRYMHLLNHNDRLIDWYCHYAILENRYLHYFLDLSDALDLFLDHFCHDLLYLSRYYPLDYLLDLYLNHLQLCLSLANRHWHFDIFRNRFDLSYNGFHRNNFFNIDRHLNNNFLDSYLILTNRLVTSFFDNLFNNFLYLNHLDFDYFYWHYLLNYDLDLFYHLFDCLYWHLDLSYNLDYLFYLDDVVYRFLYLDVLCIDHYLFYYLFNLN